MFETLIYYLNFPFVRYAVIVGVLVSLCASLLGVSLVLKRFSFIGDGLSHVAFGALAIASVLKLADLDMVFVMIVTVICAILLLQGNGRKKGGVSVAGDAKIAMLSVASLAVGYLLMNIYSTSTNLSGDVCSTLFGSTSILTLSASEVWLCIIVSAVVVLWFILYYSRIFCVTFDEDFARVCGVPVSFHNIIFSVIVAAVVVLAMNLVGSLLISALIVFPALSSMCVFKSFKSVTICSAVLAVVCALAGIIISIVAGTPAGSTIVAADIVVFIVFALTGRLTGVNN